MSQTLDENAALVQTLNRLLQELQLTTLELEDLNDLTPSLLLVILESLLRERLPISKSIRESRSPPARVEAMKIFLGVLANDLLVQSQFGETVINEVAEIDPRRLAKGEYDECFVIGEVLCRFAMSRGLLQEPPLQASPEASTKLAPPRGTSDGRPSPVPRAPSPFSVADISPPLRSDLFTPSPPKSKRPQPASPSTSKVPYNFYPSSPNTPIKRTAKRRGVSVVNSDLPSPPVSPLRTRNRPESPAASHLEYLYYPSDLENRDDRSTNGTVVADDGPSGEYHATTNFFAESSMTSARSRGSSPSHSVCTCDKTLSSEADTSYCTCGLTNTGIHPPLLLDAELDDILPFPMLSSESLHLADENPFYQFSQSRMPLDLITPGFSSQNALASSQTRIEDKTVYAHPTLVRMAGQIERVDPELDFEEYLRAHPPARGHPRQMHSVLSERARHLGPMKHTSPSEYRLALLTERARLFAEIARSRAEAAAGA